MKALTKKRRLSAISTVHYLKLVFRSLLLICATLAYIISRIKGDSISFEDLEDKPIIIGVIWVVFVTEIILRFFPSKLESMGCQRQFFKNFKPTEAKEPIKQPLKITLFIAALWLSLNAIFGILYYTHLIDEGILLLISLLFSVCDMICILFYCPFQTLIMKNKCCSSCRIYNWDYAMMFTPLIFVKSFYTLSLFGKFRYISIPKDFRKTQMPAFPVKTVRKSSVIIKFSFIIFGALIENCLKNTTVRLLKNSRA